MKGPRCSSTPQKKITLKEKIEGLASFVSRLRESLWTLEGLPAESAPRNVKRRLDRLGHDIFNGKAEAL